MSLSRMMSMAWFWRLKAFLKLRHFFCHFPVFVIVLKICATGADSSCANSFINFVGKSHWTPPFCKSALLSFSFTISRDMYGIFWVSPSFNIFCIRSGRLVITRAGYSCEMSANFYANLSALSAADSPRQTYSGRVKDPSSGLSPGWAPILFSTL